MAAEFRPISGRRFFCFPFLSNRLIRRLVVCAFVLFIIFANRPFGLLAKGRNLEKRIFSKSTASTDRVCQVFRLALAP